MFLLMLGPIEIGSINLDIHSMLFSSLLMIGGVQAVSFAVFAKLIADFHLGILRHGDYFRQAMRFFTLERGLILGFLCIILGGSGATYTFWYWLHQAFGPLAPTHIMRILIPSMTALIIGIQLVFASFFMSLLGLYYGRRA